MNSRLSHRQTHTQVLLTPLGPPQTHIMISGYHLVHLDEHKHTHTQETKGFDLAFWIYTGLVLVHPQLQAKSRMLLGNSLNAASLWPHASALSIFINLLGNLFFSTLSQHV